MDNIEILDDIEELIAWNLSYDITLKESLTEINRLDLLDYFSIFFSV
tara:strand:- start:9 stop:149 length:141 start_codon:yes stop_codon:yes gene_type:complete